MSPALDSTHDATLRSWVAAANLPGCDFPIQNLPFAVFRRAGSMENFRCGVAIGDSVLDLGALDMLSPFEGLAAEALASCAEPALHRLMALGREARVALRRSAVGVSARGRAARGRAAVPRSCRSVMRSSRCPPESATTPTSTRPFTTPPRSGACSGPTSRCCPTTSGCPSPITGAPPRWAFRASRCGARTARSCRVAPSGRSWRRARGSTTSSRSGCSSAPATVSARRSRWRRPRSTCSASASSTTGPPATCRPGNISRSAPSSPRASPPRSRPGW